MDPHCPDDHFRDAHTATCLHCDNVCAAFYDTKEECVRFCPDYTKKAAIQLPAPTSVAPPSKTQPNHFTPVMIICAVILLIAGMALFVCCRHIKTRQVKESEDMNEEDDKTKNDRPASRTRCMKFVENVKSFLVCPYKQKQSLIEKGNISHNCQCYYDHIVSSKGHTNSLVVNHMLAQSRPAPVVLINEPHKWHSKIPLKGKHTETRNAPTEKKAYDVMPCSYIPQKSKEKQTLNTDVGKMSFQKANTQASQIMSINATRPKQLTYLHQEEMSDEGNKLDAYQIRDDLSDLVKIRRPLPSYKTKHDSTTSRDSRHCSSGVDEYHFDSGEPVVPTRLVDIQGTKVHQRDNHRGLARLSIVRSSSRNSWTVADPSAGYDPPVINLVSDIHHQGMSERSRHTISSYLTGSYHADSVFSLSERIQAMRHRYPWIIGQMISNDHLEVVVDLQLAGCTLEQAYMQLTSEISQDREQLLVITANDSLPSSQLY